MFYVTVKTKNTEKTLKCSEKILLSDALDRLGIVHSMPCGGKGVCGKCRVKARGSLFPKPESDTVLACAVYAVGDTVIYLTADTESLRGITDGFMPEFKKDPLIKSGFGAAIDIGTTTVAGYIYEFPSGRLVKKECVPNTQCAHGADVISRIEYASKGGLAQLRREITEQINRLTDGFKIDKYVICGNTAMLHLYSGLDPSEMAYAPFTPKSLFGTDSGDVYIPRCISSYVGADITCSVLASGMMSKKTAFLVDIGTNGEMALKSGDRLICCSVAAGPALEGAQISCGTGAVSGAVNRVFLAGGSIRYTTINSKPPVGICGSGLIDAVSCLKLTGAIDSSGYMKEDYILCENVRITPADIRAYQLAKSAVRSGLDTLLEICGITYNDLECFYIAGGFGSFINTRSAASTGLIPTQVTNKVKIIGNGAGMGAAMILNSRECLELAEQTAKSAQTVELADSPVFAQKYMDNMRF